MSRVIYSATKTQFIQDWSDNIIVDKMILGAAQHHIGVGLAEKKSWEANANSIVKLLLRQTEYLMTRS